jgi:hypothetical protein
MSERLSTEERAAIRSAAFIGPTLYGIVEAILAARLADQAARLAAVEPDLLRAERVCAIVGWTAVDETERGKALTQVWMEWAAERPHLTQREAWPDLSDGGIAALAAKRDQARAETLAALHPDPSEARK